MARVRDWCRVAPDELITEPERWSFSWPHAEERRRLSRGLDRDGLLRPLLVVEAEKGRVLTSGHRRLGWLREHGTATVPVAVLHAEDPADLWDYLLAESLDHRDLNPVEAARYLRLRSAATGETLGELSREVFPAVGLAPRETAADDLLWLVRQPERYWEGFADGSRPVHVLRTLRRAGEEDAHAVLEATQGARGGVNKFSELTGWLLECAWREGVGVREWLLREQLWCPWESLDPLRAAVKARRFPSVVAWEEAFARLVREAGLPAGAQLQAPRGFEGTGYECRIRFAGLQELEQRLNDVLDRLRQGRLSGLKEFLE